MGRIDMNLPESMQTRETFSCPKCRTSQERGDQCVRCGLIFEKYYRMEQERAAAIALGTASVQARKPSVSIRSIAILSVLLLILSTLIYKRFINDTVATGNTGSGATIPEKSDPNLTHPYIPYPGTVTITHDRSFMDPLRFDVPTLLDGMDLEQIAAYRQEKVKSYSQLNFFHQGYDPLKPPHDKIYARITPGTPWITTVPYYIANPYILLSLTHDNQVAPFTVILDDFEITYSAGKITESRTGLNGTIWKEFLQSAPSKPNVVQLIMVNAWDAGFYHVLLVESQCENIVPATAPDNIGKALYSQSSFFHVGQHGKNNISPYDARGCITLKDITAPTRLVFHLWRKKPSDIEAKPDLIYEMLFVPE